MEKHKNSNKPKEDDDGNRLFTYGEWNFEAEVDFHSWKEGLEVISVFAGCNDDEKQLIRNFYWDDGDVNHIRNFCKKYAEDKEYRESSKGDPDFWTPWMDIHFDTCYDRWMSKKLRDFSEMSRDLYYFLKKNWDEIVDLPEYQKLCEENKDEDNSRKPFPLCVDAKIRDTVIQLNRVNGLVTSFSCQGKSGSLMFRGEKLIVGTGHGVTAQVMFASIAPPIVDVINSFVKSSRNMRFSGVELESVGIESNDDFIRDLGQLADILKDKIKTTENAIDSSISRFANSLEVGD